MITQEHQKEALSRAYVQAIAAKAGVIVNINTHSHDYGVDGSFHEVIMLNGKRMESGIVIEFQLKATSRYNIEENDICFSLDADTINLLAHRSKNPQLTPIILIMLSLPSNTEEWIKLSEEELVLRKCCYWTFISSLTPNIYSAKVKIPRSQRLTPEGLPKLFSKTLERQLV